MLESFPFVKQPDHMDCGPSCLKMIAKYYGKSIQLQKLRQYCEINRDGVSLLGISGAAEKIGFRTFGVKLPQDELFNVSLPVILHWRQKHFVVLYKVKSGKYYIADPAKSLIVLSEKEFQEHWVSDSVNKEGICLLLSPTPQFFEYENEEITPVKWNVIFRYLSEYKRLIGQLLIGVVLGSLLQLIGPFLTQAIVDIGINTKNLSFVYVVLVAQIVLVISSTTVEFIRDWILLHISTRLNVALLTDFLIKLMKLPMSFFDTKMTGDILQRMSDQQHIEEFLTGSALNSIFSFFNLIVFSLVLIYYNLTIYLVFLSSSIIYTLWIILFLKRRRLLNYKNFEVSSKNQSAVVQLINGMQEIKLNNCEKEKRWDWEHIQARLFKFQIKNLALNQYQHGGGKIINDISNLLMVIISAKAVIEGHLSFGAMVAIQYIIGQLNNPIQQFIGFIQSYQDAKISLERLNEIHQMPEEEKNDDYQYQLPSDKKLTFKLVEFKYPGAGNEPVLRGLSFEIPEGKITAIVGMSGSGKTTILKLLLRFYSVDHGEIMVGSQNLDLFNFKIWRDACGTVMQDGFIFSDTIENNIAVDSDRLDKAKLAHAIRISNLQDFIDVLPLGLKTKIGAEGNGISQGQRQRILIARAIYKNPEYLFFDEATNSLDANNERTIMENLQEFFKGKTVVIVAHRLSTVSSADNIIVLHKGNIVEQGTHQALTSLKGEYYNLVRNQLELGA